MKDLPLILEAERRGVIRDDDKAFLKEGRRRGLSEFGSGPTPTYDFEKYWTPENKTRSLFPFTQTYEGQPPSEPSPGLETPDFVGPEAALKKGAAVVETGVQMGTGFAASIPAAMMAIDEIVYSDGGVFKWENWEKYAPMFHKITEQMTYQPRTEGGKKASEDLSNWIVKNIHEDLIDKWLVEPNLKQGNPLAALLGKTAGHLLELALPIKAAHLIAKAKIMPDMPTKPGRPIGAEMGESPAREQGIRPDDKFFRLEPETRVQQFERQVEQTKTEAFPQEYPLTEAMQKQVQDQGILKQDPVGSFEIAPQVKAIQKPPKLLKEWEPPKLDSTPSETPNIALDPVSGFQEILFKSKKANEKHNRLLEVASKWESSDVMAEQLSLKEINAELAKAGLKPVKGAKKKVADRLWKKIEANRRKAEGLGAKSPVSATDTIPILDGLDRFLEGSKDMTQDVTGAGGATEGGLRSNIWREDQRALTPEGQKQLRIYERVRFKPNWEKIQGDKKSLHERIDPGEWGIPEDLRLQVNGLLDKKESFYRRELKKKEPKEETYNFDEYNVQDRWIYQAAIRDGFDLADFNRLTGLSEGEISTKVLGLGEKWAGRGKIISERTKKDKSLGMRALRKPGTNEYVYPLKESGGRNLDAIFEDMRHEGLVDPLWELTDFIEAVKEDIQGNKQYIYPANLRMRERGKGQFENLYNEGKPKTLKELSAEMGKMLRPKQTPADFIKEQREKLRPQAEKYRTFRPKAFATEESVRLGQTMETFPAFNRFGDLGKSLRYAMENLKEKLFPEPAKDIVIERLAPGQGKKQMVLQGLSGIMSPNRVARVYYDFHPYFQMAKKAESTQNQFSRMVHQRVKSISDDLKTGEHRRDYSEILLEGDIVGKVFTAKELTERQIPPNVQRAYFKTRSYYNHFYSMLNNYLIKNGKDPIIYETGYVPHFFHDFFIKVDGEYIPSARTYQEAVKRGNKIKEDNPNAVIEISPKVTDVFESLGEKYKATLGDTDYMLTQESLVRKFKMDYETANEMMAGLFSRYPRKRFLGQLLDRANVKGWDMDVNNMVQHYGNIVGRYIALDTFKRNAINKSQKDGWIMENEQKGVRKYIKDYVDDINGNPTQIEGFLMRYEGLRKDGWIGRHFEGGRPLQRMASGATSTMAVTKLGLYNVSAAIVNASQIMNTNAILGSKWTKVGLEKARMWDKGKMTTRDKGIVRQLAIEEQLGLEHETLTGNIHDVGQILQRTTRWFQAVEQFNRRTVGLGAYYKFASENAGKNYGTFPEGHPRWGEQVNHKMHLHKEALVNARQAIDSTQFDYTVYDAPGLIRRGGPIGSVLAQFKKFPIKQTEFILNLKGAEHKRFWVPYGLMVGVVGLPGADFVLERIKRMFDTDPVLEAQKALYEWVDETDDPAMKKARIMSARLMMYGIPSLVGVNVSARIGIADLFPQDFYDLLGPTVGTTTGAGKLIAQMIKDRKNGDWSRLLKKIATAPGNAAIAMEGTTYGKRGRKIKDLLMQERLAKLIGFRTIGETEEIQAQNMILYSTWKDRKKRQRHVDRAIPALERNDRKELREIGKSWAEKGLGNSDSFKAAIREEIHKKGLSAGDRAFYNQGRRMKAENLPWFKNKEYR